MLTMGNMPVVEVGGRKVRVTKLLSEGGYANVFKAVDELGRKDFALKTVRIPRGRSGQLANEKVAEMAVLEQSVVRSLPSNHPNILKFHDAGITKADNEIRYFILSEYCPSNVLQKMSSAAAQGNLLPEAEVLLVFRDTLMAVLYLHSRDPPIAHRDLKVDNLLVGRDGLVKLCNFGSCSTCHRAFHFLKDIQLANEDIRRNTTPAYRSPEQVDLSQGHVISEKVDIWALGVILFKLTTFQTPFEDSKGRVDTGAIIKGLGGRKIPQERRYSSGLISLIRCCLVVEPERRPTIGQILKLCEELNTRGVLPDWPGPNSLPRTPPDSPPSSPRPWDILGGDESPANSILAGERGTNESGGNIVGTDGSGGGSGGGGGMGGGGGGGSGILVASPRRSQRVTRTSTGSGDTTWMARVGDGMRSKWYKLMGREQQKRLWVLKTTSQNSTGPQPKYVGKIVAALWEKELTMGSVFMLVRDRPLAESPVVAMKALITLMKVLQQGPPHVLSECTTYAPVVEEIGHMWGPIASGSDDKTKGVEAGGVEDPALSLLILRCATMIVQKIRFHEHHPEYRDYWSRDSGNDTDDAPNSFRLPEHDASDEPRTLQVISRLLILQGSILTTMTEALTLLGKGAKDAGPSTRSALPPLMAESYLTYFATTRVLLAVSEKYSTRPRARPEQLVALAHKYEVDLKMMRELYSRADGVEEVAVMKRTPRLPGVSPLSEGGAKRFREMSCKFSRQSTFAGASSKMEALKTLQDEERRFIDSNSSKLADGHLLDSEGEEDDGVSDDDDDDDDDCSLFAKESDDHDAGGAGGGGVAPPPLPPRATYGWAGAAGVVATTQAPTPPPYHLFAKALDATAITPGQAASVKDSDVYGSEENGPWEDGTDDSSSDCGEDAVEDSDVYGSEENGPWEDGTDDSSSDCGEDAVGARRKDDFPASSLDGSRSHGSAVGKSIPQLVQDPFLPGAAERVGSEVEFPLTFPKASNSWVGATGLVGTQQTRAGAAGGAAKEGSGDIRSAGGGRNVNPGSKTGGSLGGDSSNAGRDLSSGISSTTSAMLEVATELAQNCPIPLVSEAATLMSLIVKLVSDSRDNIRGIEKRLARCRSVITLLGSAAKVIGKGADSKGEAERHMFDDVRDAIVDLVDLIKTYQSRNRLSKVLTSSVFKRREEEANLAIDRAILRSNWGMVANLVEAVRPGPEGSGPCVDGHDEYKVESVSDSSAASRRARRQRKLDQIEIPEDEVSISDELLGKGGFGAVYIGDYLGRNVACKVLQIKHGLGGVDDGGADEPSTMTDSEKRQRKAWLRELEAMIRLRSPHIVHVYGKITCRKDRLVLVMELLVGGDLRLLLKKSKPRLPEEQCRGIIGDVCAGMAFLHSKHTVYGDLKSANVLLDGDGRAKIGDFGTSRWAHHTNSTGLATYTTELGHNNKFSLAWSAPEVLNSEGSTMESDVYSFGVVVWEIVTTELPWANKKPLEIYCAVLGGRRPDFPLDTPAFIADVARRCWAGKADERPTFRAIMEDLR